MMTVQPTARQMIIEQQFRDKAMGKVRDFKGTRTNGKPKPNGKLVRQLMNQAKLKPAQLAEKAKTTSNQMQKIFNGVGTDILILEAVAEVFEIKAKDIIK